MRKFFHFLSYNNAVPLALGIVILGAGGTYAATNPDAIVSATSTVQSIDNTFIVNTDLSQWDFKVQVTGVTQDSDMYYVTYQYETMQLQNDVWQKVIATGQLKASKKETDQSGIDLGIYIAKELSEVIAHEKTVLASAQAIEKGKGASQRTVATTYSGLVGKFLSPTEETFAGYQPVVDPLPTDSDALAAANAAAAAQSQEIERTMNVALADVPTAQQITAMVNAQVQKLLAGTSAPSTNDTSNTPHDTPGTTTGPSADQTGAPVITINGESPAHIFVGDVYSDLGASITGGASTTNLSIHSFVDGHEMDIVMFDTSAPAEHHIVYRATDGAGRTGEAERIVIVAAHDTPPTDTPPVVTPPTTDTTPAVTPPATDTPPQDTPPPATPPADATTTP